MSGRAYTRVELQRGHGTKPTQRTPGSLMEVHLVNSVNERGTRSWNILVTLRKLGCGDNLRTKKRKTEPTRSHRRSQKLRLHARRGERSMSSVIRCEGAPSDVLPSCLGGWLFTLAESKLIQVLLDVEG